MVLAGLVRLVLVWDMREPDKATIAKRRQLADAKAAAHLLVFRILSFRNHTPGCRHMFKRKQAARDGCR